ncbi:MAG: NADH-ubiquinone oxidoreductase-F iron-sulfur binding region domain-containing protein [Dehalococcoidia bacterium]|nr:NADH-ubiquinone oxidoreductase-F iron-sulfur binding region domain-containing protein [Dehalococcoidia bacterium]
MPQKLLVLRNCGIIDPQDIASYLARGGFEALRRVQSGLTPAQVIDEVKRSGLRGRGGGGFPTGLKWEEAARSPGLTKYVVCNAAEGEVGAFKDRYILEKDPFTLMEGMAIAAYAVGAAKAYLYLRAEYAHLVPALVGAVAQVSERGFFGIVGDGFGVEVRVGSGGYVCGEETALMESLEGRRGEPRMRPPYPPSEGLLGSPTVINNVETLMNVPWILSNGADAFCRLGTAQSRGTKVFSVSGDVERPGVYELEMGSSLSELVCGIAGARDVKSVQVGGASGRLVPGDRLDAPLSYEGLCGAGPVIVFDSTRDMVDIMYRTMEFFAEESCGKCTPCREGTQAMMETLGRITAGRGERRDLKALEQLSATMMLTSSCGLGQAAPVPVLDSLRYFRHEYEARLVQ